MFGARVFIASSFVDDPILGRRLEGRIGAVPDSGCGLPDGRRRDAQSLTKSEWSSETSTMDATGT
jgi:hypothetical protein